MKGHRYYSFSPPEDLLAKIATRVEFFGLDSTNLDRAQIRWLDDRLTASRAAWKICFFHHPLYSSGERHGSEVDLRSVLEPLFVKHGVSVVFSGHEHFYERIKPQKGIYYFISGAAGKLRSGNIAARSNLTAKGFDTDLHFMLVEIAGDEMYFQTISRAGKVVDSGVIRRTNTS
jgi:3',5'-cyclic AMP phosphodiesterase CpdA